MRIAIAADEAFSDQTRAYAEYRVFSSLARFSADVRDATVSLSTARRGTRAVICAVAVSTGCGAAVRVSARGRHAHDAIDRAAGRAGEHLRRRARALTT